jgi:hypothetical protein
MSNRSKDRRAARKAKGRNRWPRPENDDAWNGGHPNQAKGTKSVKQRSGRRRHAGG